MTTLDDVVNTMVDVIVTIGLVAIACMGAVGVCLMIAGLIRLGCKLRDWAIGRPPELEAMSMSPAEEDAVWCEDMDDPRVPAPAGFVHSWEHRSDGTMRYVGLRPAPPELLPRPPALRRHHVNELQHPCVPQFHDETPTLSP